MKRLSVKPQTRKTLFAPLKLGLATVAALATLHSPTALATSGLDLQSIITGSIFNCNVLTTTNTITPYVNTSGNIAAANYQDSVSFTFVGGVLLNFDECDYVLTLDGQTGDSAITSATITNPVVTSLTHTSSIDLVFDKASIDGLAIASILNSSFVWSLVGTNKN